MKQDRKEIKREKRRLEFVREARNRRSGKKYKYDSRFPLPGDKFIDPKSKK
ncbi:hypothetical protein ES708_02119 [subsurface metagenome]